MQLNLRQELQHYSSCLATIPVPAYICDSQGGIVAFNTKMTELWGRSPKRFSNDQYCGAFRSFWPDGVRFSPEESPMANALRLKNPIFDKEMILERPDGSRVPVIANVSIIKDPVENQVIGAIQVFGEWLDVFYFQQELISGLQKAIAARDELISLASHEFRTPITSMQLQYQMILHLIRKSGFQNIREQQLENMLRVLDRQVKSLNNLSNNLLDFTRYANGKLQLDRTPTDLAEVVGETLEYLSRQIQEAQCQVSAHLEKGVIGNWDRNRIEQIAVNLISNALKYGKEHPISVEVSRVGSEFARLKVADQGIGISKENQEKIFERFERVTGPLNCSGNGMGSTQSSTRPYSKVSGLGLGLYIVKQSVLVHGGKIFLESELLKGSTFIVELPLHHPIGR